MNNDAKDLLFICGFICAIFALIVSLASASDAFSCSAQWKNSGYEHSYGPIKGCVVRVNGRWIPADNVREIGK